MYLSTYVILAQNILISHNHLQGAITTLYYLPTFT